VTATHIATEDQDAILTAALDYARRGWSILPIWWVEDSHCACPKGATCRDTGKHPIGHMAPAGFNSASKDLDVIRQWHQACPKMNIAVATGAPSNIVVLDLDFREIDDEVIDGEFELRAWLAARGIDLPDTLTQSTGGGGKHIIMSLPATSGIRPFISSRTNWLPGVDIRGDGGYIVVAPSQHASGQFYQWDSQAGTTVIAQELLQALSSSRKTTSATGKSLPSLGDGESLDVKTLMQDGFRAGGRDDGFVRLVGMLRARGDSLETAKSIVTEVWQKTDQPEGDYFPLATALEKVERGYRNWDPPEPITDSQITWAISADARAGRRQAALGDTLRPGLGSAPIGIGNSTTPPGREPQRDTERPHISAEDGPEDDLDEDDLDDDRNPVDELDIAALMLGGEIERELPTMLARSDGKNLVYPGKLHSIYGEPGHGKTWVSLHLVHERLLAGESVVYFDYDEDDGGRSMALRLVSLGLSPELARNLHYYNPQGIGRDGEQWAKIKRQIKKNQPTIVIVDTMAPALVELGLNEKDNAEVGAWYRHARWLIAGCKSRPALVIVDHVVKSGEGRGRWARGAGDKLGRLHVAYAVESTVPFSRERPGSINLIIAKDRGGEVGREGDTAATIKFTPANDGQSLSIEVTPAGSASIADLAAGHENVKNECRKRVLEMLKSETEDGIVDWPAREIKRGVRMQAAIVDETLEELVNEGVLAIEARGRALHYLLAK
jgi:Bifunctional DNA primase/polymerase, N-terminal/AAA domain